MADHYQSSSSSSSLQEQPKLPHIHFNANRPIPEQWTEVNEYYMEKKDTYKVRLRVYDVRARTSALAVPGRKVSLHLKLLQQWTSGMNYQLRNLGQQLVSESMERHCLLFATLFTPATVRLL